MKLEMFVFNGVEIRDERGKAIIKFRLGNELSRAGKIDHTESTRLEAEFVADMTKLLTALGHELGPTWYG